MTDYKELVERLRTEQFTLEELSIILPKAAAAIEALQAEVPKRGKWIWDDKRCIYVCSMCGSPKVRENMDRQIIKEQAYCYSCGAKMEVQDGK